MLHELCCIENIIVNDELWNVKKCDLRLMIRYEYGFY